MRHSSTIAPSSNTSSQPAVPTSRIRESKKSPKEVMAELEEQNNWLTQPLATLPRDALRKHLERHAFSLHEVELGARREFCDWEFQRRDEGFEMMFQDLQEMRGLGRLLVLKIRLEIVEGRIDSAIHWLQTGFAMARHVGSQSSSLIQMLIASAITTQMTGVLEELVQAPGAPNLYWALANLPRPFSTSASAMEGEKQHSREGVSPAQDRGLGTLEPRASPGVFGRSSARRWR